MSYLNYRKYYKEIIVQLKKNRRKPDRFFGSNYIGNTDPSFYIQIPVIRKIAKEFSVNNEDLLLNDFLNLLDLLFKGKYNEEKQLGGKLLQYYPKLREQINPSMIDNWLNHLNGWAQVDSLCQSTFSYKDMLKNWDAWKQEIIGLSENSNINKRRASLVLLTAPVRQSKDERFSNLAFSVIDRLREEKDILITKAISWLLREMIKYHKNQVIAYIQKNEQSLPKLAFRETRRKLLTGKK